MRKFNVGIVGYGWAATAHISAINAGARGRVTQICSSRSLDARAHARDECLKAKQRLELRQEKSAPILAAFKQRLEELLPGSLHQSPLGKAMRYTLVEWEQLNRCAFHRDCPRRQRHIPATARQSERR